MKVTVIDLEGEEATYSDVERVAFTNNETFGLPDALKARPGETVVLVNVNGYSSLAMEA